MKDQFLGVPHETTVQIVKAQLANVAEQLAKAGIPKTAILAGYEQAAQDLRASMVNTILADPITRGPKPVD